MVEKITNRFSYHILGIIFIIAVILRFISLENYPVGFHIDEAVLGYNGFSFLKTGMDESGTRFPLYLDTFGDQNPIGYHVLTILPISIFGISEFATRFPAAFFGSLSVIAMYFLCYVLFRNNKISLLAAFFLALSPWSVNLSRGSSEALTAVFFVILGFACTFFSIKKRSILWLLFAFLLFVCSFFIYPAPRVFVPLLAGSAFLYLLKDFIKYKKYAVSYILFLGLISFVVALLIFVAPGGTNRFKQTSIFSFPEVRLVMEEQIREDGSVHANPLTTRFFHNKPVNFSLAFVENYLSYFSGQFLFMKGGLPMLTVIPHMGLVYLVEFPFILYAMYRIFSKKDTYGGLVILWLLLAPVVASLTVDDSPNVRRAVLLVPAIEILAAYGVVAFFSGRFSLYKKGVFYLFIMFFLANVFYFLHQYFVHSQIHRPWYRNNGFSEMMGKVNSYYNEVDKVILTKTGGGYPLVLFYSQYDPFTYQQEGSPKDRDYKGFGKYIFVPQECPSLQTGADVSLSEDVVYVDRGNCEINKGLLKRDDIPREDGSIGFRVYYREGSQE